MKPLHAISLCVFTVLFSLQVNASDVSLRYQARELEAISREIAYSLRGERAHRDLYREAEALAREARLFRDAVEGRYEHRYVQSRYDALSSHYRRFDRHYHTTRFTPYTWSLENSILSISLAYRELDMGWSRHRNAWDSPSRYGDPVIVFNGRPDYGPFGISHDYRKSSRHDHHDRHDNRRYRDERDERGRRNHYK